MNKRAIIILSAIFLLIVGTLGYLLYARSNSQSQNPATNNTTPSPTPSTSPTPTPSSVDPVVVTPPTSPVQSNGLVKLTENEVISPVLFYRGDGISYFDNQGQLYQIDLRITGNTPAVSNKRQIKLTPRSNISKVLWPPDGNNFIAVQKNGTKNVFSYYDGKSQVYTDLPIQMSSVAWIPDASKIIYIWQGSQSSLNISNPDGTGFQKLAQIYYPDSEINLSPDGKNILFYRTANSSETNPITLVTSDGKIFKTMVKEGYNLGISWAPDSKSYVFTRRDPLTQNFSLWLGNILTDELKNLNVSTTIDKVLWSPDSQSIFVSGQSVGETGSSETIYKISLASQSKTQLVSSQNLKPQDFFLSLNSEVLFFKNLADGALYGVSTAPVSQSSTQLQSSSQSQTQLPSQGQSPMQSQPSSGILNSR